MSSKVTVFYLVRHGQSATNVAKLISGHIDPALTRAGIQQAQQAQKLLSHVDFDEVYSSDLERAKHTASVIYGEPVPEDHLLEELRERNFGVIDGLPEIHMRGYHDNKLSLPEEKRSHYRHADGMETDHELAERYLKTLNKIAASHSGNTVLIGSHGSAMRSFLVYIGWGTHRSLTANSIKNTAYVKLLHTENEYLVEEVNGIELFD